MINHEGKNIEEAYPSMPVEILGMNSSAFAGAEFLVTKDEDEAKTMAEYKKDNFSKNKVLAKDKATLFDNAKEKDELNLERALLPSTRMGGHFVQGHVDCVKKIKNVQYFDKSSTWTFEMDDDIEKYIVEKGSIALNGVSLTVASKNENTFDVALIPHTIELTTFGNLVVGDSVNVEVDILGKYIENFLDVRK